MQRKVGRPALGLPKEERKKHDEKLRLARYAKKKEAERYANISYLITKIRLLEKDGYTEEEIAQQMTNDKTLVIKYQKFPPSVAGYSGERLSRNTQERD